MRVAHYIQVLVSLADTCVSGMPMGLRQDAVSNFTSHVGSSPVLVRIFVQGIKRSPRVKLQKQRIVGTTSTPYRGRTWSCTTSIPPTRQSARPPSITNDKTPHTSRSPHCKTKLDCNGVHRVCRHAAAGCSENLQRSTLMEMYVHVPRCTHAHSVLHILSVAYIKVFKACFQMIDIGQMTSMT